MESNGKPTPPRRFFSSVAIAREVLRERADELINEFIDVAKQAKAAGDYEAAYKALQWLIDHIPADESGARVVEHSSDKVPQTQESQSKTPNINIGIALGGIHEKPKQLPKATVIESK
jgi:hypothetical protein